MIKTNKLLKEFNLPVLIFIPSQIGKRPPIYEGLPTIEDHRHLDLLAILSEIPYLGVDVVCFGDAYCREDEIKEIMNFNYNELNIPIKVFKGISDIERNILLRQQVQRVDVNQYFVRSSIRETKKIAPFNTINRNKFMITIDNKEFSRYQGEVGIMKVDLDKDNRVNVVGQALISEFLLRAIKPKQKFIFTIRGDEE